MKKVQGNCTVFSQAIISYYNYLLNNLPSPQKKKLVVVKTIGSNLKRGGTASFPSLRATDTMAWTQL